MTFTLFHWRVTVTPLPFVYRGWVCTKHDYGWLATSPDSLTRVSSIGAVGGRRAIRERIDEEIEREHRLFIRLRAPVYRIADRKSDK